MPKLQQGLPDQCDPLAIAELQVYKLNYLSDQTDHLLLLTAQCHVHAFPELCMNRWTELPDLAQTRVFRIQAGCQINQGELGKKRGYKRGK